MYATDFVFDGINLSDYGFIICEFDYSSGAKPVSVGSEISFTKVQMNGGRKHSLVDSKYEECYSFTFDICKNPDIYDPSDMEITSREYRSLVSWLNQHEFKTFKVVEDFSETNIYFNASFNIEKIKIANKIVGIRLSANTDAPFGYGDIVKSNIEFTENVTSQWVYADTDEVGLFYPDLRIECLKSGDLQISNVQEFRTMAIRNCREGEVINIFGESRIIESNYDSHNLSRDFNFEFIGLCRNGRTNVNEITSNLPCIISISYYPIIKDTPN